MTKEKRIEDLRVLLERRIKFYTKNKNIKVGIFQRKILVLNENGENFLRKGPYTIDLESLLIVHFQTWTHTPIGVPF